MAASAAFWGGVWGFVCCVRAPPPRLPPPPSALSVRNSGAGSARESGRSRRAREWTRGAADPSGAAGKGRVVPAPDRRRQPARRPPSAPEGSSGSARCPSLPLFCLRAAGRVAGGGRGGVAGGWRIRCRRCVSNRDPRYQRGRGEARAGGGRWGAEPRRGSRRTAEVVL